MHNLKKRAFVFSLCLILLLLTHCDFIHWLDPMNTQFPDEEPAVLYEAAELTTPPVVNPGDTIKVMTWNLKYGGGRFFFFWEKDGYKFNMTAREVTETLDEITDFINLADPDILLIQEVDKESKRSAYVDQCQYILDNTDLNYGAYGSIWHGDLIPTDGVQRMDMGNLTLSKWEITSATRINLPLRTDNDALTEYFYFQRNLLRAAVSIPNLADFYVLNIHTEPFSREDKDDQHTKKRQIDVFKAEMDRLADTGALVLGGGDFNSLPDGSVQWKDFPEMELDDERVVFNSYEGEETWMNALLSDYNCPIPLMEFAGSLDTLEEQEPYHTFPSSYSDVADTQTAGAWNRTLDYLFSNNSFTNGAVLQEVWSGAASGLPMSDHAPIISDLEV